MSDKPLRVMWLLNHGAARKFEIPMLKAMGVEEIFLPKSFPQEIGFRSASIDYSEDPNLTIPASELAVLNAQNWYISPTKEAWAIANKYFDICFFICQSLGFMNEVSRSFQGAAIWRAYGQPVDVNYSFVVRAMMHGSQSVQRLGRRLWFGIAYEHLADVEPLYLQRRKVFLPLGLSNCAINDIWKGNEKVIFFVCPDIGPSPYYGKIYDDFIKDFGDFPYKVGGAQPIEVDDPNVLGFVTSEEHDRNMRECRLMFYHSQEPNHIHYHPYEAIRVGMPLVFMAGGILDRMGGVGLPGRCQTIAEAKTKIRRILDGDEDLIRRIRESQGVMLDPMHADRCVNDWRVGLGRVISELALLRSEKRPIPLKKKKIAVIVPVEYRGGSLRGAKLMAQAIFTGSRDWGEPVDVILLHPESAESYQDEDFKDINPEIQRRAFCWESMDHPRARRAMRYAGHEGWEPTYNKYLVVDDGIKQLLDCDAWVVISDRVTAPLLPLKPCLLLVYDYLQRYEDKLGIQDSSFIDAVRLAQKVIVTTEFTRRDAIQYAGVDHDRVVKLPVLAADFSDRVLGGGPRDGGIAPYFVWTTNAGAHKNHLNSLKALAYYYEILDGGLDCQITGVDTKHLLKSEKDYLQSAIAIVDSTESLQKNLHWLGELPDFEYRAVLGGAAFLWHTAKIDNGTFSAVEAAYLNVPALSSDYPAMREIDEQFSLNLTWMDSGDYKDMAEKLKEMERTYLSKRANLPSAECLGEQHVDKLGSQYWEVIRECL